MLQMLLRNFYVWNKNNNYVFLDYIHLYILYIIISIVWSIIILFFYHLKDLQDGVGWLYYIN